MAGSRKLEQPATTKDAPLWLLLIFCSIWTGLVITEAISNNVLPLTIRDKFNLDPKWIGLILAINPAFGFIAQPVVGILSDRIWTPVGRRAFFLITGAPIVALCLVLVPESVFLWQLVTLVIVYQFFQDVLWGSDHPLMADLLPPHQRTLVQGMILTTGQLASFLFLRFAMANLEMHHLYWVAAALQVFLVAGAAFFLNEKPVVRKERPKLTAKRYILDVLGDPSLSRFAGLYFFHMVFLQIIQGWIALYAVTNILLTRQDFGKAWSIQSLIPLFLAIITGHVIERYTSKQWSLIFGYTMLMITCVYGYFSSTLWDLSIIAVMWGVGNMVVNVALKPFTTEYIPSDIIGQVTGALNIFFAIGRTAALAGGGILISIMGGADNYRPIWILGLIFGAITIAFCVTLPDLRFQERKQAKSA